MEQNRPIALVTGAGSGIGRAIALELSEKGYYIIIACRSQAKATDTLTQIQNAGGAGEFVRCDVSDGRQIDSLMEHIVRTHGHLEVLVNNAGISNTRTMDEIDEAEWENMLAANLEGPFFLCRHAFHIMQEQHYGRIINLASIAGERGAAYGITVNAVSPGTVDTPMSREEGIPSDDIPMGRAAEPEEVAHAVCFLASEQAGYLTGVTLDVNGGQLMR